MNNTIERKRLFLHLGPPVGSSIRSVADPATLMLPTSLSHDGIWQPRNLEKLGLLEKEISTSNAKNVVISSDTVLPYFFTSVEKMNNKSMWQGDAIRKMFFNLSKTHDITLIYYVKPVFEHLKESYALNFSESKYEHLGQKSFDNFCKNFKKQIFHHQNVESWSNISGIKNIVVRPYINKIFPSSNYLKDVFSTIGIKSSGSHIDSVSQGEISKKTEGIVVSEKVIQSFEEVYVDNKELCEKFLDKKEARLYLQTFAPHYGELTVGLGSSLKRFFGF
jgi:hypothetical protein